MSFEKQLPILQEALRRQVSDLNGGGCAMFCFEMSIALRKVGVEHSIKIFDIYDRECLMKRVDLHRKGETRKSVSFGHALLEVGGKLFDGYNTELDIERIYFDSYARTREDLREVDLDTLSYSCQNGFWNSLFNKDRYESIVIECIEEYIIEPLK